MERTLSHFIEYEVKEAVAIGDVIKSLQANDRLLRHAAEVIETLVPGLQLEYKKVSVASLTQSSPLKELFAFAVVVSYQKDLEEEVPDLVQSILGIEISDRFDTLVTVMVLIVAILGIARAFEALFPGRDKEPLERASRDLAGNVGEIVGKAPEVVIDAADAGYRGRSKRSLVSSSQKLFAPTRGDPLAAIRSRSGEVLVAPPVVELAQAAAAIDVPDEDDDGKPKSSQEFENGVDIILHAMDRDSKKRGWAGHIPKISDERIPMTLEKNVSPDSLFGRGKIRGDVLVKYEEDSDGQMVATEFLLIRAYI